MLKVQFETENVAFKDPAEAGKILRHISVQIDAGMTEGSIMDSNKNVIGEYSFKRNRS